MPLKNEVKLQGIAQLFVLKNLLEQQQALEYYQRAIAENISLIQYLIKSNILSAGQIAGTLSEHFGMPLIDLNEIDIKSIPISLIDEKLIRRYSLLPLFCKGNSLYLAAEDPRSEDILKEIQFHTGLNPQIIIAEADKLSALIAQLLVIKENQNLREYVDEANEYSSILLGKLEEIHPPYSNSTIEDAPIVKFVNQILFNALNQGASDIHFEPFEKEYRIRYRQDGLLHEIAKPPINLAMRIATRIKILAQLDISEKRIPQDGGFQMSFSENQSLDFRVSTCPTTHGEKIVVRILDAKAARLDIGDLGLNTLQKEQFLNALQRPQGMVLITGPTGSGKTVSLYTALNRLNSPAVNISTAEDPVEIKVAGINQVNINPKVGLTFSNALRSFLRQDPDIIMIGEIRDLETAEIAIKAAQTGHLVLSTLHTNSAIATLIRLTNMGIPHFNIVGSVNLIIAQRLARTLCIHCKELRTDMDLTELMTQDFPTTESENFQLYKARGCKQCNNGYKGRIGLFEVLPVSDSLGELILSGKSPLELLKQAQLEGMISLYQSGLEKVKQGITTIEEIYRVTGDI